MKKVPNDVKKIAGKIVKFLNIIDKKMEEEKNENK